MQETLSFTVSTRDKISLNYNNLFENYGMEKTKFIKDKKEKKYKRIQK